MCFTFISERASKQLRSTKALHRKKENPIHKRDEPGRLKRNELNHSWNLNAIGIDVHTRASSKQRQVPTREQTTHIDDHRHGNCSKVSCNVLFQSHSSTSDTSCKFERETKLCSHSTYEHDSRYLSIQERTHTLAISCSINSASERCRKTHGAGV